MADIIGLQELADAKLDAKSLEDVVNGNETKQVTTRLGESYPSVKKAIKTLFENGGLPATPFKTKALMTASALVDGKYAQVTDDSVAANNGLYVKTAGAWVESAYDPLTQSKSYTDAQKSITLTAAAVNTDNAVSEIVTKTVGDEIIQGFTDKDGKLLAFIDKAGELDFYPTAQTKNRINAIQENIDSEFLYLLLDANNKIIDGIDKNGDRYPKDKIAASATSEPLKSPLKSVSDIVTVKSCKLVSKKLSLNTIAKGRTTDPDIAINGDGLTHPKMLYIPQGWNGYMYWLTATPTFGVIGGQAAYENPHVWASNDLITWVEPSSGRLDKPEDNSSWWSDSHLALDDDGWLYCIYRGNYFTFANHIIVAKRSRDGVNWSERIVIYNSANEPTDGGILSPAIYKKGDYWHYVDLTDSHPQFEYTVDYGSRGVFRRTADKVTGKYTPYSLDTLIKYPNKSWSNGKSPWHIDALAVGNIHLQLINVGATGVSSANELYIAYSSDGWNYQSLPKLDIDTDNAYRSSLTLKKVEGNEIHFDMLVARTGTGQIDLYNLILEIK